MSRLRPFIGPFIVGTAVWCAAGDLTVLSSNSASARLAVPASWAILFAAVGAAAFVPAWRRDPRLALPALLSTLPWWPVPLPAIALLWTGPLAWVPIAGALIAALGSSPYVTIRTRSAGRLVLLADPRRAPLVAGALTLAMCVSAAWWLAPRTGGGDEPGYFAIAHSLWKDGDLRIDDDHQDPDFIAQFGRVSPDSRVRINGAVYSIHAPGLSALILPGYVAAGYRGGQATVMILGAIIGGLVWLVGWRATNDAGAAWLGWAAVVLSPTFLIQSATVFPDGPAALPVAAAILLLLRLSKAPEQVTVRGLVGVSLLLAFLPWLHTRLVFLAIGFGAAVVWQLWSDPSRSTAERQARVIRFLIAPAVAGAAWLLHFYLIYGTFSPTAPYPTDAADSVRNIPGATLGLFFDQQYGLFVYAPLLFAAAFGARHLAKQVGRAATGTLMTAGLYVVGVTTVWMWWAGVPAPPARFAAPILPVFALLGAVLWARGAAVTRLGLSGASILSVAMLLLVLGVDRGALAWNFRTAQAAWLEWLNPIVNLPRGWPSFFLLLRPNPLDWMSELPFILHAMTFAGLCVIGWMIFVAIDARRRLAEPRRRLAGVWTFLLTASAIVQAGWLVTSAQGLNPARSQLAVLSAGVSTSVVELGPLRVRRRADPSRGMTIRTEQLPAKTFYSEGTTPPLLSLTAVPAGTYELRFFSPHPRTATAQVKIDRGAPIRTLSILPIVEQAMTVSLPAGAASLQVLGDQPLPETRVEVVPLDLLKTVGGLARSAARYGDLEVFFVDGNVFAPEDAGFWIRGGQVAEFVVVAGEGRDALHLELSNGANPNGVTVSTGGFDRTLSLKAGEGKALDLPFPDAARTIRIRISSPAGFRPSDQSASPDSRYLGVKVSVH